MVKLFFFLSGENKTLPYAELTAILEAENLDFSKRRFEVKCDECGQKAIVPFKPTAGRKVFCQNCFSKQKSNNPKNTPKHSFNANIGWARRTATFTGKKEKKPTSIFQK